MVFLSIYCCRSLWFHTFGFGNPFFFAPGIIFSFLILVPAFAVTARRLHDTGRSGWWQLTAYIPYIGIIASIILIVVFCTPGEKKANKFGKPIKLKH